MKHLRFGQYYDILICDVIIDCEVFLIMKHQMINLPRNHHIIYYNIIFNLYCAMFITKCHNSAVDVYYIRSNWYNLFKFSFDVFCQLRLLVLNSKQVNLNNNQINWWMIFSEWCLFLLYYINRNSKMSYLIQASCDLYTHISHMFEIDWL